MRLLHILFVGLFIFIVNTSVSFADESDNLKASDVTDFLSTVEILRSLADEMETRKIPHFFEVRPMNMLGKDVPSHLKAVENIKKDYPKYYKAMSDVLVDHAFDGVHQYNSVEEWAKIADRILLAFYTSRSDGGGRDFKEMSKKAEPLIMMSKMNPESTKHMQGLLDMLKSFSNVTPEDVRVVSTFHTPLALHFGTYPQ